MRRLRVLISSHEFHPYKGSECAVGWNIVTKLAAYHDVTVLAAPGTAGGAESYRKAVSDYVGTEGAIAGLRVVFVEQPAVSVRYARVNKKLMKLTHGAGSQPLFFMGLDGWHEAAFQAAQALGFENFDVVHQLTPISFLRPGFLWRSGLPFFWGPIAGMSKVPSSFARSSLLHSYLFQTLRSANITREIRTSRFNRAVRHATRIWTVTEDERRTVDGIAPGIALPMIDTAPPAGIAGYVRRYDGARPLKLCWSGRHDARKALPLMLHAIARLPEQGKVVLNVLGEGTETKRWKTLAGELSLRNVQWLGRLPYDEALRAMGEADALVHSAIIEATSMVVLEAMAWGLPVLCHDAYGMAAAVDESCGIKVPFVSPERSIEGFRFAIEGLLRCPGLVEELSEGALARASRLSWDSKAKQIAEAYVEVAGENIGA
ncbi:MAG: glycosyltransferase [Armatimonadetes bacterium]|nr:glycosyltransferase [Armatimonadota bacterium]